MVRIGPGIQVFCQVRIICVCQIGQIIRDGRFCHRGCCFSPEVERRVFLIVFGGIGGGRKWPGRVLNAVCRRAGNRFSNGIGIQHIRQADAVKGGQTGGFVNILGRYERHIRQAGDDGVFERFEIGKGCFGVLVLGIVGNRR